MKSAASQRVQGKVLEISGAIKAKVGAITGNESMELDGEAKRASGQARQEAAKAGERAKGTVEQVAGTVKSAVGELVGDASMELEGEAKKLKGKARKKANQ